jgi:hypothetical protein
MSAVIADGDGTQGYYDTASAVFVSIISFFLRSIKTAFAPPLAVAVLPPAQKSWDITFLKYFRKTGT